MGLPGREKRRENESRHRGDARKDGEEAGLAGGELKATSHVTDHK